MLIATFIEAGLPWLAGIELLARDLPAPISQEVSTLLSDMREHDTPEGYQDAFRRMLQRVPTHRAQLFAVACVVGWETGSIASVLGKLNLERVEAGRLL